MQVKDVMTKEVITAGPEDSIVAVAKVITQNRFHGVPIAENKKLLGIVTESDFFTKDSASLHLPSYVSFLQKTGAVQAASAKQKEKINTLINVKAKDIMTADCVTVSPEMEIGEAVEFFKLKKMNSFPVVNNSKELVGIITLQDVINLI